MDIISTTTSSKSLQKSDKSITTLAQMWEATIGYFEAGTIDTTAMQQVSQQMTGNLTFQDIANVFSAVYANTYWATTQMDAQSLANSMRNALGLNRSIAKNYAQQAISQWRGIFCRSNLTDTGVIPETKNYSTSIDIVCNGATQVPPPALIQNWNQ